MKKLFFAWILALVPVAAMASGAALHLDRAPNVQGDKAALQEGAGLFVNYCLNCHGASYFRYQKLQDLGLSKEAIEQNLMFTADKIGEPMRVAARPEEIKKWFGVTPPDLTIIARARASADGSGADWLYTYLRSFHRDAMRPTGWNNVIFPNVGMPHVLWNLQGARSLTVTQVQPVSDQSNKITGYEQVVTVYDTQGETTVTKTPLPGMAHHESIKNEFGAPVGALSAADYDKKVANLVGFLVWIGEPEAAFRQKIGIGVLIFLAFLFIFAYALKKDYWKDIH